MLRRIVFKSSLPAIYSCGRKSIAEVATSYPLANGRKDVKNCHSSVANDSNNSAGEGRRKAPRRKQRGVEKNQKRSDDFAELGPLVSEHADSSFKLVTEVKRLAFTRKPRSSTVTSRKGNSLRVRSKKQDQGKHIGIKVEAKESRCNAENKNHANSSSVYICNVPQSIKLMDLDKAVAAFGRIKSASATKEQNDFTDYHITFENIESKDRAAAAKSITVNNCKLSIHSIGTKILKIKITNVSWSTAEPIVHSKCASLGCVSGLTRTKDGAIEVILQTNHYVTSEDIVENLNNVSLDDCQWSAQLLSVLDGNTSTGITGSRVLPEPQISNLIKSYRRQLQMQQIYLDDLDSLHHAISHLRDVPADMNS